MAAGRPTTYSEDMLQRTKEYLDGGYLEKSRVIPSVVGLARYLDVSRSTLYLWGDDHDEFSDILDSIKDEQHEILVSSGLTGDFNPTMAKLMLTKHGYSDKQELTGNEGGPIELDTHWTIEVVETKDNEE
jgi:hypothetical protein